MRISTIKSKEFYCAELFQICYKVGKAGVFIFAGFCGFFGFLGGGRSLVLWIAAGINLALFGGNNTAIVFGGLKQAFAFNLVRCLARLVNVLFSFLAPFMASLNHHADGRLVLFVLHIFVFLICMEVFTYIDDTFLLVTDLTVEIVNHLKTDCNIFFRLLT